MPRFESENNFIADLNTAEFWIGVNDLQEEGKFVTVEGDLSYTNWYNWQPDNHRHSNGYDEDGVTMNWASKYGYWNDAPIDRLRPFVCLYRTIESGQNRKSILKMSSKRMRDSYELVKSHFWSVFYVKPFSSSEPNIK